MNFLKKILPWIGAAATGNVPALVTLAAKTVGDAVGKPVKESADAIAEAVAGATPEQIAKLRELDHDFQLKMQAMGFEHAEELEKIAADDRASARAREIALRDRIPAILAIGITAGFFSVLALVVFHRLPAESRDTVNIMLGALGTAWIAVVTYYFGSSAGSDRKNELLAGK